MNNLSPFQMALLGFFGFSIVVGVLVFALYSGSMVTNTLNPVRVWGSFDQEFFENYLTQLNDYDDRAQKIIYQYIPPDKFDQALAEAISAGRGPDLVILEQSQIIKHWPRIKLIPYENFITKRDFLDRYIDATEAFLGANGIIAMPFSVDPLIMYYNRDIFAEKGIARPPSYWDEVISAAEKITEKDEDGTIELAGVALGTFSNIEHAKEIYTAMVMQKGGKIVEYSPDDGKFYSRLIEGQDKANAPAVSALRIYTEFANPSKYFYSWNKAMEPDIDAFAQYKLAIYFGLMSDYLRIKEKNPNLNFDLALFPQMRADDARKLTGGKLYGVAVVRGTKDPYSAIRIASFMSSPVSVEIFNKLNKTSSPYRGHLEIAYDNEIYEIIRRSTLMVRVWLDPDPAETFALFKEMVDAVLSGRLKYTEALNIAHKKLSDILLRIGQ